MRHYNFFTLGAKNAYGQATMPAKDAAPEGTIKMAINNTSTTIQDSIKYKDCSYMGLTQAKVDDTYIIEFNGERLKVQYTNSFGRYTQVFMKQL